MVVAEVQPVLSGMAKLLQDATSLFTWVTTNLGTIVTTITANPILLLGFLMGLCGFVVGIVKRLMNLS